MQKKWITISFISVLLLISLISFVVTDEHIPSGSIIRSASTETYCKEEQDGMKECWTAAYSGFTRFAQNSNGEWVDASDVLFITKNSDDITFHYDGIRGYFNITFEAGVIYNENYYSMADVKQMQPGIGFNFPTQKYDSYRKYAVNITNITLNKALISDITLTYKDHYGFTLSQFKKSGKKYFIKDIMRLGFKDLLDSGFTIDINISEKRVSIGNITLDKYEGDDLYLDPTSSLAEAKGFISHDFWCQVGACWPTGGIRVDEEQLGVGYILLNLANITSLSNFNSISEATLRLNANDAGGATEVINVSNSTNTSFTESNLPSNYRTGLVDSKGTTVGDITDFTTGVYQNVNVTDIVSGYSSGDDGIFAVILDSTWEDTGPPDAYQYVTYDSKTGAGGPIMNVTYTLITRGPSFSDNSTNNTSPKYNQDVQFNISINDTTYDISGFIFSFDKATNGTWINDSFRILNINSTVVSVNKTIDETNGTIVTWKWYANNTLNNWNVSTSENLRVTNTAPVTPELILPANDSFFNYIPINLTYNSTDIDGDTLTYYIYVNLIYNGSTTINWSFNATDGLYNWSVVAGDSFANSSNSSIYQFTLDTTPPYWANNNTNNTSPKLNQDVQFNISINDTLTNVSGFIFSFNDSGTFVNDSFISFSGNKSGIASVNKTITKTRGTVIEWKWYANDTLNNWNVAVMETLTVADTAVVAPTISSPTTSSYHNSIPVNLNYSSSDADGDTITYYVYINGTLNGTSTLNWSFNATDGLYNWTVMASTADANTSNATQRNLTIDTVAPTINVTAPTNGTTYTSKTVILNFTTTDLYLDYCTLNLTRTASGDLEGATNRSLTCNVGQTIVVDSNTDYTVHFYSFDLAGNSNSSSIEFTIAAPSATPPGGGSSGITTQVAFNLTTFDLLGIGVCGNTLCEPDFGEADLVWDGIRCEADCTWDDVTQKWGDSRNFQITMGLITFIAIFLIYRRRQKEKKRKKKVQKQ